MVRWHFYLEVTCLQILCYCWLEDDPIFEHDWNQKYTKNIQIWNCRKQLVNAVNWWSQSFVCDEQIITTIITCFHVFTRIITPQLLYIVLNFNLHANSFFPEHEKNNKYWSSFPYFLCNKFYGSQLQVQDRQISRIRKCIYI